MLNASRIWKEHNGLNSSAFHAASMGRSVVVFIDPNYCKGCGLCIHFCPHGVFEPSTEVNRRGYRVPVHAHPEKCVGCMLCEHLCPDLAICISVKEDG